LNGGERDLSKLLKGLKPRLLAERYAFRLTLESALQHGDFALIREEEGLTRIAADPAGDWACITLDVHSSLHAVGLTAALSARLTEANVSANIVAGLHHDHIFVPWGLRDSALEQIKMLSDERLVD